MKIKTPDFRTIPLDKDMAKVILLAIGQIDLSKDSPATRLIKVIQAVFPEVKG